MAISMGKYLKGFENLCFKSIQINIDENLNFYSPQE